MKKYMVVDTYDNINYKCNDLEEVRERVDRINDSNREVDYCELGCFAEVYKMIEAYHYEKDEEATKEYLDQYVIAGVIPEYDYINKITRKELD